MFLYNENVTIILENYSEIFLEYGLLKYKIKLKK